MQLTILNLGFNGSSVGFNGPVTLTGAIEKLIEEQFPWKKITLGQPVPLRFEQIKLVADRRLDSEEIGLAAGCLGYALTETLRGEELPLPRVAFPKGACGRVFTELVFDWDSSSSIRTAPDPHRAFEVASVYCQHGTPVRTTERAGAGTRGTRLVAGIDTPVSFWVR